MAIGLVKLVEGTVGGIIAYIRGGVGHVLYLSGSTHLRRLDLKWPTAGPLLLSPS